MATDSIRPRSTVIAEEVSRCAREPIHTPETILDFGALMLLDEIGVIQCVSDNGASWFGAEPEQLLGTPAVIWFADWDRAPFQNAVEVSRSGIRSSVALTARASGEPIQAQVLQVPSGILVEFEEADGLDFTRDVLQEVQLQIEARRQQRDLDGVLDSVATFLRSLTEFDRAMVYRFDEDGHGKVVAESVVADLEPFLGLQYPAHDIPVQARKLYLARRTRYIHDVDARASHLLHRSHPAEPVDLSNAILRSVSPYHLQYLRNMGVASTLAMSIVIEGKLWGMLICHHRHPTRCGVRIRSACDLLGQLVSYVVAERLMAETVQRRITTYECLSTFLDDLIATGSPMEALGSSSGVIQSLVGADGFAVRRKSETMTVGQIPAQTAMDRLQEEILRNTLREEVFCCHAIADRVSGWEDPVAGVMHLGLNDAEGTVLMWFRNEESRQVDWAGRPPTHEESIKDLTPRASFERWREVVRGTCARWSDADRETAAQIGRMLGTAGRHRAI